MRSIFGLLVVTLLVVSSGAQAQGTECFFTGTLESLALYHAPLTHPTQLKDKLPGGITYRVQRQNGEHYLITVDHAYGGWVDRRSGSQSGIAQISRWIRAHCAVFQLFACLLLIPAFRRLPMPT